MYCSFLRFGFTLELGCFGLVLWCFRLLYSWLGFWVLMAGFAFVLVFSWIVVGVGSLSGFLLFGLGLLTLLVPVLCGLGIVGFLIFGVPCVFVGSLVLGFLVCV